MTEEQVRGQLAALQALVFITAAQLPRSARQSLAKVLELIPSKQPIKLGSQEAQDSYLSTMQSMAEGLKGLEERMGEDD